MPPHAPILVSKGMRIHKQWGATTHPNPRQRTTINLSVSTYLPRAGPKSRQLARRIADALTLDPVVDALISAGFPAPYLLQTLDPYSESEEIRADPITQLQLEERQHTIAKFPLAVAVIRLTNTYYRTRRSGHVSPRTRNYEYTAILDLSNLLPPPDHPPSKPYTPSITVTSYDFGTGKPGRPSKPKQTTVI